jgi:hypothetical protein
VTLFLHRGADIQARSTGIGHEATGWKEETLDEMKEQKMMRRRKKLIRVFTLAKHALFISTY